MLVSALLLEDLYLVLSEVIMLEYNALSMVSQTAYYFFALVTYIVIFNLLTTVLKLYLHSYHFQALQSPAVHRLPPVPFMAPLGPPTPLSTPQAHFTALPRSLPLPVTTTTTASLVKSPYRREFFMLFYESP